MVPKLVVPEVFEPVLESRNLFSLFFFVQLCHSTSQETGAPFISWRELVAGRERGSSHEHKTTATRDKLTPTQLEDLHEKFDSLGWTMAPVDRRIEKAIECGGKFPEGVEEMLMEAKLATDSGGKIVMTICPFACLSFLELPL